MAATGRPPKPVALKQLEGTYRPDRDPGSPTVAAALPACPAHLPAEAKAEWERIGAELLAAGLVTEIDKAALTGYCTAWALAVTAAKHLQKEGSIKYDSGREMVADPLTGKRISIQMRPPAWIRSPWLGEQRTALDQMAKFLREFGMSPSSRAKVAAVPADAPGNEDLLANVLAMRPKQA